ncbi:purine nucleoside phosphorylase 1 [bacterium BMS3Abin05]|nr:purine nucleoside phosphorylase 1 [bacterium BMS3Abin05]GBE26574.1 purine nucleoside phosphorylase 1 [bacterium BMS3Bbin03]
MTELMQQILETTEFLRTKTDFTPETGIILGTGLGGLVKEIDVVATISYKEIPHFPISTVEFHAGNLIFGRFAGKKVVVMQGRFHYYEGYSMKQITFPVRVMKQLGAGTLLVSNAAGALNPLFHVSDIMIIVDHINLLGDNPLIGQNDENLGPRFPDMSEPYTKTLIELAETVAIDNKIPVQKGVFAAMTGPSLETRAEYRFLRMIGADAIGMSTIPEVIVAVHSGMKILGLSVITDMCLPDALEPGNIQKIIKAAAVGEPKLMTIIKGVVERLS